MELEKVTLVVGKQMPGLYFPEDKPVTCIVAVPSRTYDAGQIERRTKGREVPFVMEAETLIENGAN